MRGQPEGTLIPNPFSLPAPFDFAQGRLLWAIRQGEGATGSAGELPESLDHLDELLANLGSTEAK